MNDELFIACVIILCSLAGAFMVVILTNSYLSAYITWIFCMVLSVFAVDRIDQ